MSTYASLIYDSIEQFPKEIAQLTAEYLTQPVCQCVNAIIDPSIDFTIFKNTIAFTNGRVFLSKNKKIVDESFRNQDWKGPLAKTDDGYIFEVRNDDEYEYPIVPHNPKYLHVENIIKTTCNCQTCTKVLYIGGKDKLILSSIHGLLILSNNSHTLKLGFLKTNHTHSENCRDIILLTWDNRIIWFSHNQLFVSLSSIQDIWDNKSIDNKTRFQTHTSVNCRFIEIFLGPNDIKNITQTNMSEILCVGPDELFVLDIDLHVLLCKCCDIADAVMLTSDKILLLCENGKLETRDHCGRESTLPFSKGSLATSLYKTRDGSIFYCNASGCDPLFVNQPDAMNNLHSSLIGKIIGEFDDGTLVTRYKDLIYFYT